MPNAMEVIESAVSTVVVTTVVVVAVLVVNTVVFDVLAGIVSGWVILVPLPIKSYRPSSAAPNTTEPFPAVPDSTQGAGGVAAATVPKFPFVTRLVVDVSVDTTGPVVTVVGPELRSTITVYSATTFWANSEVSVKVVNVALLLVAVALTKLPAETVAANVVLKARVAAPVGGDVDEAQIRLAFTVAGSVLGSVAEELNAELAVGRAV